MQSGDPMAIPGNVYLIGDPRLESATWDRLFKTGVIDERRMMFNAREEGMYMAPYYCRRDKQGNMFGMVYSKRGIQLTRITPKG